MAFKLLAVVAALALVAANASPLVSDATHFDKVSEMIQDAQDDNFGKAGMEAETMPAWETPAWMGRRTNSTSVQLSSTLELTGTFTGMSNTDGNNAGTATYLFFSCIYLKTLGFTTCPSGSATVVSAIPSISVYSQGVTITSRRGSGKVAGSMTTTKWTDTASATSAATAAGNVDSATLASYVTAAGSAAATYSTGQAAATPTVTGASVDASSITTATVPTPTPTPTAAAGRTTTFGIAALIAAMFAQLF